MRKNNIHHAEILLYILYKIHNTRREEGRISYSPFSLILVVGIFKYIMWETSKEMRRKSDKMIFVSLEMLETRRNLNISYLKYTILCYLS